MSELENTANFISHYYKFEIIPRSQEWKRSYILKTLQNREIKIQERWNFIAKIETNNYLIPRKSCTIFVVAHKDLTSFFFFFFTRAVSRGKSGRQVLRGPTLVHSPNWSMAGRQFYLRGWEGGTRTETRPRRACTRRISGVKATGPALAGWNGAGTRNQGPHLPAANYPAWKKLRTEPVPLTFLRLLFVLSSNSTASFSPDLSSFQGITQNFWKKE